MNNQKLLEKINDIIRIACDSNRETAETFEYFKKFPNEEVLNIDTLPEQLETLRREIIKEIYAETKAKRGGE